MTDTVTGARSRMQVTGKKALIAFAIAFLLVLALSLIYAMMWAVNLTDGTQISIGLFVGAVVEMSRVVGLYAGPLVFLLAFALLQRVRIK